MSLTAEQTFLFRHNGFVKLPERLPAATVTALRDLIWQHIRDEIAPVVRDKRGRVVRISRIWERGGLFREILACAQALDPLESLLGPNIELLLNRHNHATLRLAGDGSAYYHRDTLQWSRTIVTVLFYLEETTVANGCTWVVPGTHLLPGRPDNSLTGDEAVQRAGILDQAIPVPMPAGGLLAMDGTLMHSAGMNTTEGTRMSLTVGYHSADELAGVGNPQRVLVRGQSLYKGNDAY